METLKLTQSTSYSRSKLIISSVERKWIKQSVMKQFQIARKKNLVSRKATLNRKVLLIFLLLFYNVIVYYLPLCHPVQMKLFRRSHNIHATYIHYWVYLDNTLILIAVLGSNCSTAGDCKLTNSACVAGKCQCASGFTKFGSKCLRKTRISFCIWLSSSCHYWHICQREFKNILNIFYAWDYFYGETEVHMYRE